MSAFIKDLFSAINKNKVMQICISVACLTAFFVANDRKFPLLKYSDIEISPEIIAVILFSVGAYYFVYIIIYIIMDVFKYFKQMINKKRLIKSLCNLSPLEKKFLYDRLYKHKNERSFCVKEDAFFYPRENDEVYEQHECYNFDTDEDVGFFIRKLERKGILKEKDEYDMVIPDFVWNVLKENSQKVFNKYGVFIEYTMDEDLQ